MSEPPRPITDESKLGILVRAKVRSMRNRVTKATAETPIRVWVAVLLVLVIWIGLYFLFWLVFGQFRRTPLEATVAVPLVFNFFFLALLAMLTFSNAIVAHGALFSKLESEYLLSLPVSPRDIVALKLVESLLISSWSLTLLGLPLMLAVASLARDRLFDLYAFYLVFLALFLAFIPIPGALGLMLAWIGARFIPQKAIKIIAVVGGVLLAAFMVWGVHSLKLGDSAPEVWLRSFLAKMSFVEAAFLPNNWVACGIDHALHNEMGSALMYVAVTATTALFLTRSSILIVSRHLAVAYDRAAAGRSTILRQATSASGGLCGMMFFYLPTPLRLIAAKDLRTFFRDPLQWSQLVILFGLIILYLTNMPSLNLELTGTVWPLFIPFLNLCAISFILATFTCRFVFPLVSLEGRQLWLIGLVPMPRGRILHAKFAFAMTVTLLVTCGAMAWGVIVLGLGAVWACIHLAVSVAICFGLCGLAVGLGARLPMLNQSNAARIANGVGGTVNLLMSLALVCIVLVSVGFASWRSQNLPTNAIPDLPALLLCGLAIAVAITTGQLAMSVGARHFDNIEA